MCKPIPWVGKRGRKQHRLQMWKVEGKEGRRVRCKERVRVKA